MKTKQFFGLTLAVVFSLMSNTVFAQETDKESSKTAQITFAYPLGSNGTEAIDVSNNFSFNVLYGVNGGMEGMELGGLVNYNHGEVKGFQLAGVANVNKEKTTGLMWSGVTNISADENSGAMLSGIYNLSVKESKGVQIAEVNNAVGGYTGVQMGLVNYASKLKGVQIGLVNVVGDAEGAVPIGLFSVVKGGHYELEIVSGEVIYTNLNYKMGVEHFYTIFKLGFSFYENKPVYTAGIGFGGIVTLAEKHKVSIDLSINEVVYDEDWDPDATNYLTKLDINYKLGLGEHMSLVAGPSFNRYVSAVSVGDSYGTLRIPYDAHTVISENNQKWMWVGFNAGLAYKF